MNDQTKSAIQTFANFATAVSAILALLALGWAMHESNKREASERTENWKRPAVYSIIRDKGNISFEEIKSAYLQTATQRGLSGEAIQDLELDRIILSLQENNLIGRNSSGNYEPITVTGEITAGLLKSQADSKTYLEARARVISILESESGKHTIDSLNRKLKEEGTDISHEMMVNLVTDLKLNRLIRADKKQYLYIYPN